MGWASSTLGKDERCVKIVVIRPKGPRLLGKLRRRLEFGVTKLILNNIGTVHVTDHWGVFVQPLLLWKSSKYYIFRVCVCSLGHPACKARASYYIGRPRYVACLALPYFSKLSHQRHDFQKKKALNAKCALIFSTTFVWNISNPEKNSERYYRKCS
jgi:hypothetical protein